MAHGPVVGAGPAWWRVTRAAVGQPVQGGGVRPALSSASSAAWAVMRFAGGVPAVGPADPRASCA